MKYFLAFFAAVLVVACFGIALVGDTPAATADEVGAEMVAGRAYYYPSAYSTTSDTITDAENDTLTVPANLISPWGVKLSADVANLSGTTAMKIYIQGSTDLTTAKDWYTIDSVTVSGAGVYSWEDDRVNDVAHRFIIDGSGTQSSTYDVRAVYKTAQ